MSLGRYFTFIFSIVLLLLFVTVLWFNVTNSQAFLNDRLHAQNENTLQLFVANISPLLQQKKYNEVKSLLNSYAGLNQFNLLTVVEEGASEYIFEFNNIENNTELPAWLINSGLLSARLMQKTIKFDAVNYIIQLQSRLDDSYDYLYHLLIQLLLVCLCLLLLCGVLSRIFSKILMIPISALEVQTKAITKKHYPNLKSIKTVKEMAHLVKSHNKMTVQVKSLISELSERLEHAKKALYRDEITQLGNRRLFCAQFSQLLSGQEVRNGALFIIRIHDFENIRAQEGFQVAKALLVDMIHVLQMDTRQGLKARLYRMNEYEFACILLDVTKDEVASELKNLSTDFDELQQRFQQKKLIYLGATMFSSEHKMSDVLARVDEAIEIASKQPKNFHLYDINAEADQFWCKLNSMEAVLAVIEQAELKFEQQQVMRTDEKHTIFHEIFTRFAYKERLIPAKLLQAQAEKFNCPWALDKRVISEIRKLYLKQVLTLPISINISAHSLLDGDFRHWLGELSESSPAFFNELVWEFDEFALSSVNEASMLIQHLHDLGSKVAVDHFGTSDNTLQMLRQWQVDIIKIDGSYIHDLEQDRVNWFFIETIVKLAHSLNIVVVCEQIESTNEKRWAKELGADGLQGFHLDHPKAVS